jgi:pyrrolidone-carboxylate peptidase
MKIYVAGFGLFGDYPANTSELVVKDLNKMRMCGKAFLTTDIYPAGIPIGYDRGWAVLEHAIYTKADAVVLLGMASSKKGLCIETHTKNSLGHPIYYPTDKPEGVQIDQKFPLGESFALDLGFWKVDRFRGACTKAGIATELSSDPGAFCCNHLMFQMHRAQMGRRFYDREREKNEEDRKRYSKIPWIFIHVPCCQRAVPRCPEAYAKFISDGKKIMRTSEIIRGLQILFETIASE